MEYSIRTAFLSKIAWQNKASSFSSNALYILSFQVKMLLWAEMSASMAKSSKKKMSAIEELARGRREGGKKKA